MELRVGDVARAAEVAQQQGLAATIEGDCILVPIDEATVPPLIAALAKNDIEVFHVRERTQSLEELFIEATGGETVG
jgi:hypothetical protein